MLHYTCRSLDQYLEKLHRYATWGGGRRLPAGPPRRDRPSCCSGRFWRFVRMYVIQAGFLDGRHGLVLCALQAYGVFLKWAKVWEWERFRRERLAGRAARV